MCLVWGNAYEMGYAQGQLLSEEIRYLLPAMMEHWEQEVVDAIDKYIGEDLAHFVAQYGLQAALDLEYEATRWYTPSYFYDEMKGIHGEVGE